MLREASGQENGEVSDERCIEVFGKAWERPRIGLEGIQAGIIREK